MNLPADLRAVLDRALEDVPPKRIASAVDGLIERYRGSAGTGDSLARTRLDFLAYAAYRMPATYAAVGSALDRAAIVLPDFAPRTQRDLGGGTGAAVWAATEVWPELGELTVVERAGAAIEVGRLLAAGASSSAVRETTWQHRPLEVSNPLPAVDLTTMAYVLGELTETAREPLIRWVAGGSEVVALVEPGTPDGYARIITARDTLLDCGMSVVAPCPHDEACPVAAIAGDWCHFSVRLERTWLHRYVKAGSLGFEDEKFSYVVAAKPSVLPVVRPESRVLRHPKKRKGHLSLTLCTRDGEHAEQTVSKSQGARYRAARRVDWGDEWPPVEQDGDSVPSTQE